MVVRNVQKGQFNTSALQCNLPCVCCGGQKEIVICLFCIELDKINFNKKNDDKNTLRGQS